MKPLELAVQARFPYGGPRGWYVIAAAPFRMDRDRPEIVGQRVSIDGQHYDVARAYGHRRTGPVEEGEMLGLRLELAAN